MSKNIGNLPQLNGDVFLVDAGLETDFIFNKGIDIPEFAAHTLLPDAENREQMKLYFNEFIDLAAQYNYGLILDAPTWKAHNIWMSDLGCNADDLEKANHEAVSFVREIKNESKSDIAIVLNGITGPCGDAYAPEDIMSVEDSEKYHAVQISWLADAKADMVSALTFTQSTEAAGYARAASAIGIPCVISFTVETDGKLPSGQSLREAIEFVDSVSDSYPSYFMLNCAHPDHFAHVLDGSDWTARIRGLRCNASRQSHAELDACEVLDDGDPVELGRQYRELTSKLSHLNVFGGCCGSDIRHVREIAKAVTHKTT